ncbi:MAG: hypothetical protein KKD39_08510, partial [Candidatus Altiarchaeota archaeon]|nr:hypothetical protein [Candidatus Altiarchaeota archaeon]
KKSDDLSSLKSELDAERKRHGFTPSKPSESVVSDPVKPELVSSVGSGDNVSEPVVKAESRPSSIDDDLSSLKSELDAERKRHGIPAEEPVPKPETQKPEPEPAVTTVTPPDMDKTEEKELEELKSEVVSKKETKGIIPPMKRPITEQSSIHPIKTAGSSGKPPVKKIAVVFIILAIVGVIAYVGVSFLGQTPSFTCWNGELVEDSMLCPPQPTTTTILEVTTSTSSTSTTQYIMETTTSTQTYVECSQNSDCVKPTPYIPFCDSNYVKAPDVKYTCIHPGTPQSYCKSLVQPPRLVKVCQQNEYCWAGECYPEYCRNKKRDIPLGEQKIDCGGLCRPCNQTDILCNVNTDCGVDACGLPYCNKQQNPTNNCTRNICYDPGTAKATCGQKKTVEILEVCGRARYCVEGQDDCMEDPKKANCHDCTQNQGEEGVDCGGPCVACAKKPIIYDRLNLTATDIIEYQGYQLKLDRLIREINCSTGVKLTITDLYSVSKDKTIDRHANAQYFDMEFGFLHADTNSALIWIRKHIPE